MSAHTSRTTTTHRGAHTTAPPSLSVPPLPCRKDGFGYKAREERDGALLGKHNKKKGGAALQSCWKVKACLENTAYAPAQPFPSQPCLMLWSASSFLQAGDGLGVPLFWQQLTCLRVQGDPSHPRTPRVHPGLLSLEDKHVIKPRNNMLSSVKKPFLTARWTGLSLRLLASTKPWKPAHWLQPNPQGSHAVQKI